MQHSTLLGGRSDGGSDEDRAVDYSDVEEIDIGEDGRMGGVSGGGSEGVLHTSLRRRVSGGKNDLTAEFLIFLFCSVCVPGREYKPRVESDMS